MLRGYGFTTTPAGCTLTGSIVATAADVPARPLGNHLRTTLALMPWLSAIPDTEAPGSRHWAATSRLNWSVKVRRFLARSCAGIGTPFLASACFMVDAIFTPPDIMSQVLLAVPLWLLYELGMVLAQFIKPVKKPEVDQVA